MAKIEGVKVKLGETEYEVPPLTIGALRRLTPRVRVIAAMDMGGLPTEEQLEAVIEIAAAALRRNYPELTNEQLEELLDLRNMQEVLPAVLAAAGLERKPSGEEQRP